jgi:endonuclease/exonuclease/phosphatase family metal-dependent hydrolase
VIVYNSGYMLKIMTLNLWCYFDWDNRKGNINVVIKNLNPDFIAFQEAQTNHSFSDYPQSDFIADTCGYKYRVFAPTYKRDGQIDVSGGMTQETSYGLALISKYPIVSSETYFLRQHPDHDEACSVLFCKIDVNGKLIDVCNVHFGNSDLFSDLHLNELMDLCEKRHIQPILLGDFNHFNLGSYKENRLKNYMLTTDAAAYESMPKNNGTLDYIVVPSSKYTIKSAICPNEYVSDHRALFAVVE